MAVSRKKLERALEQMLDIEEIGSALPLEERLYCVVLNTGNSSIRLIQYSSETKHGLSTAQDARQVIREQMLNRLHELLR